MNYILDAETLSQFYKYSIFVLFAVVLTLSFPISTEVFIPFNKLLTYEGIENAIVLVLAIFFILTSWLGYFNSITLNPHTETKLGLARFTIDLFIIYLYYYFLGQVTQAPSHPDIFLYTLPLIFGSFLLWDSLRYLEYKRVKKEPTCK